MTKVIRVRSQGTVIISSPGQIGGPRTGQTDAGGKVRFPPLQQCAFGVVVSAAGFGSQTLQRVEVIIDQAVVVNVPLAPVADSPFRYQTPRTVLLGIRQKF